MRRRKSVAWSCAVCIGGMLLLWAAYASLRALFAPGTPVERSQDIVTRLGRAVDDPGAKPPSPEAIDRFEADFEQMSDREQLAVAQSAGTMLTRQMETRLRQFFALPPDRQRAALDAQVDRIVRAKQVARARQMSRRATASAAAASPARSRRWQPLSGDRESDPAKTMLDLTTPELRGMQAEYARLLGQRLRQRAAAPLGRR